MQDSSNHTSASEQQSIERPAGAKLRIGAAFFSWLRRTTTSLFVFAAIGGVLVWGHHADWSMPKFSSLVGNPADSKDDWCSEHSVPESQCVECNPDLLPKPKGYGWCKRHGVHECPLEHPEVAQTEARPQVSAEDLERAQWALDFTERPENYSKCKSHERRIQFKSTEAVERAGIGVEPVWKAPVVEFVTGNGEITCDQTRTARLSTRVPGIVFQAIKQVGDPVQAGEVIALVDAAEVGKAKSEFVQALVQVRLKSQNFESGRSAATSGAIPDRMFRELETALSEARIRLATAQEALTNLGLPIQPESLKTVPQDQLTDRLRFLCLPQQLAESFDGKTTTGNLLPLASPFAGVVVARDVVAGEVVDSHKVLFTVVDIRQVWLTLDLRLEDAKAIRLGQKVRFRPDGGKDEVAGTIAWISTEADPKTRTVKVRAILANAEGRLRSNTFGVGRIILREESQAVVVPNEAVHWEGDCYVAFVRDKDFLKDGAPKVFHVRTVRLGAKDEKQTEIIAGVLPGELVATKGSAALRAELLRGNLGEG